MEISIYIFLTLAFQVSVSILVLFDKEVLYFDENKHDYYNYRIRPYRRRGAYVNLFSTTSDKRSSSGR